ncbi:MAG: JAB domain-containing protein [Bacteroidia bacterium]|nr:JAB domain-containing protein [Bacteroidia bacterium]
MVKDEFKVAEISVSYRPAIANKPVMVSALDAYVLFKPFFNEETISLQEDFMVMYLNKANRVLGIYPMSKGGITSTTVDIRLIFAIALTTAATGIILAHNHPSGNLKASRADIDLTHRIKDAAKILDIALLDHLIISPVEKDYFSFADAGVL